jgi:uronate dehydrogenase
MSLGDRKKILVTGSAGRIGKAAASALLAQDHFVRGFDRVHSPHASEPIIGNIADYNAISEAVADMDQIIHLAATPDDADFMSELLPNNIIPVHHILEAARVHKVKRVILASTGQVNWYRHIQGPFPVRVTDPIDPRYWYAVTKVFAEYAGMIYAHTHGLDVLAVRLGACPRDRELLDFIGTREVTRDVYLSPGDAGRFFEKAVAHPGGFGFQVVYVCSKWVLREILDLEPARRLFGYKPQDRWPQGIPPEIIGDKPIPGIP